MSFAVKFSSDSSFKATFTPPMETKVSFTPFIEVPLVDYYDGDYSITPTDQTQTIPIIGKTARQNITIDPIPNNYGLITWNGAVLTVS